MKRLVNALLVLMLTLLSFQPVQAFNFNLSGQVLETDSLIPVANHPVELMIQETGINGICLTAEDGTYSLTLMIPDTGSNNFYNYIVRTYDDCINNYIVREGYVTPEGAVEDFTICENGSGTFDCYADFEWQLLNDLPTIVQFIDRSIFQPGTWSWDFGDGQFSNEKDPIHTFATGGAYQVSLTITGVDSACFDSYSELIILDTLMFGCDAYYHWQPSNVIPYEIQFNDMSIFQPGTWAWDFGDGGFSFETSPVHTYQSSGTYTVSLTITGADSVCFDTYTEQIVVDTLTLGCEANFDWQLQSDLPYLVFFNDLSIFQPGTWDWDFGDGSSSNEKDPVHMFSSGGEYTVTLTINGYDSTCYDTYTEIVVLGDSIMSCQANFWWHHNNPGINPLEISFVNNSYTFSPIVEYSWDFGDGAISNEEFPVHVYSDFGIYQVSLEILTEDGCTSSQSLNVLVNDPNINCMAMFVPVIDSISPLEVAFLDLSIGAIDEWLYDFGDGTISYDQNPVHLYPEAAVYLATLTIVAGNCTSDFYYEIDLINGQVTVNPGGTTGINSSTSPEPVIYPNPVKNILIVNSYNNDPVVVQIINLAGQTMIATGSNRIDVSRLPNGIYFAKINSNGKIVNHKFIKE